MSFHVEGDYFESCTCRVSCPCTFLAPATEDGVRPAVISNPLLGVVTQPIRQARSGSLSYTGDWKAEAAGTNGFITEFEYHS